MILDTSYERVFCFVNFIGLRRRYIMITKGAEMITLIEFIKKFMEADEDVKSRIETILTDAQLPTEHPQEPSDIPQKDE